MKEKIFLIFKVVLTVVSGSLSLLLKSSIDWPDFINCIDTVINHISLKEYIYDISIGVFSSMILVCFIDEISKKISEKNEKKREYKNILNTKLVLDKYIYKYEKAFYSVVTPINQRNISVAQIPEKIHLKNMKDLYKPSYIVTSGLTDSAIQSFFQIEEELRNELKDIVKQNSFEYYPQFIDCFTNFIEVSIKFHCREFILDAPNRKIGRKNMATIISKRLENFPECCKNSFFHNSGNDNNILFPYISLSEMMMEEYKIISNYKKLIGNLSLG